MAYASVRRPADGAEHASATGALATEIANAADASLVASTASATVTVKVDVPATDGTPLMAPVAASSESPPGSAPPVTAQR